MRVFDAAVVAAACLRLACAQSSDIRFPEMGLVYDARVQMIRPIHGTPGASWMGEILDAGLPLGAAAVSPRQDLVLGVAAEDQQLRVIRLRADGVEATPLAGAMQAPATITFSPSGESALLAGAGIQVVTGLSAIPALRGIAMPAGGPWGAMAISDDGNEALLAPGGEAADPVWLIAGGDAWQLPAPGSIAAAAFRARSGEAVAITRSGDVYLIRGSGPNAEARQVFMGDERTADPVAISFAADGRYAYTANRSGMLAVIEIATGSLAAVSCGCTPTGLNSLGSGTLFRITDVSDAPLMLFDAAAAGPRVWFVPRRLAAAGDNGREQ